MKRFGRTKSVVTEGSYIPSGQSESSVGCVGDTTLPSQSQSTGDVGGPESRLFRSLNTGNLLSI